MQAENNSKKLVRNAIWWVFQGFELIRDIHNEAWCCPSTRWLSQRCRTRSSLGGMRRRYFHRCPNRVQRTETCCWQTGKDHLDCLSQVWAAVLWCVTPISLKLPFIKLAKSDHLPFFFMARHFAFGRWGEARLSFS